MTNDEGGFLVSETYDIYGPKKGIAPAIWRRIAWLSWRVSTHLILPVYIYSHRKSQTVVKTVNPKEAILAFVEKSKHDV